MAVAGRRAGNSSTKGNTPGRRGDSANAAQRVDEGGKGGDTKTGDRAEPDLVEEPRSATTPQRNKTRKKPHQDQARRRVAPDCSSTQNQRIPPARHATQTGLQHSQEFQITAIRSRARSPGGTHPLSFGYILQPRHPIQWAPAWPELIEYYTRNAPDYTGLGLYDVSRYPDSHKSLLRESSINFTVQILIAERAKLDPPVERLAVLKGFVLKSLNESLQRELDGNAMYHMLNAINAIALYDLVYEGGGASALHLAGLSLLLRRFGGLDEMLKVDFHTTGLLKYCDALYSYFQQEPRRLAVKSEAPSADIVYGIHHLRLAMQPDRSGLSEIRWRNHLVVNMASPVQGLFIILGKLHGTVSAMMELPMGSTSLTPSAAIALVREWDDWVVTSAQRPNELRSRIFCNEDKKNHLDMFEMIRLATGVLLQQFRVMLLGTDAVDARAQLDYYVQALLMHILSPKLAVRSPQAIFWACWVAGPFLDPAHPLMGGILHHVRRLSTRLRLAAWRDVKELLISNFYSTALQESACLAFWGSVQQQTSLKMKQGAAVLR